MRRIFTLLLIVMGGLFRVQAQTYPVQATTQLLPPYSLFLADYVRAGSERLVLNVYLADIARPSLDVRFRLRIVGQGITLETKAEYRPAPVQLHGGVPLRLVSTDLADYFNPNNLNFQGISRTEFNRTGKLPEGAYQFCFEVLEYNRGVKISGTACAMAWLILNDPPIINLPANNAKLTAQDPQNVLLQWTPRHTGSPNSAFNTEYDVRLVEVWPSTRNPNDAVLSSPAIFETTTTSTAVLYGPAETPLEPGRRYAFRIRARGIAGMDEIDLFKNNGYSEVFTFVYGDACDLPTGISAASIGTTRFSLSWTSLFNHTGFRVRYREMGTANWYENRITLNSSEINGLKPGTTYEYQVAATCGFYDGKYATVTRITTEKLPEVEYACGVPVNALTLDPALLTGSLKVGDIIQAGDFDVKLTKVSGSNGVFTGEGVIEVPYFNKAKVKTEFTGISVNKEMRMVNGHLDVTGAGVDVIPQGVTDFIEDLNETLDDIEGGLKDMEENMPKDFDPHSFVPDEFVDVKDGIQSVYKDDDGSIVIVDNNGNTQTLPPGTTAAIKDDNGKGFLVDKKGNIHKTTSAVAAELGRRKWNLKLTFARHAGTQYGLEKVPHPALANDYEEIKGEYPVLWKSVAVNEGDPVTAILGDGTIDMSKVRFEMGGVPMTATPDGDAMKVTIQEVSEGEQGLLALYEPTPGGEIQVLGKLNVATYAKITHEVVVVPVNMEGLPHGLTRERIRDSLNFIYRQAAASWNVTVREKNLTVSLPADFDDGGTGILSNYTSDMKKVINAYGSLDDDKYYLFLIAKPKNGLVQGYMPRGKSAGFVFVSTNPDQPSMLRTMAHELGHGVFNLHHIFDEPNFTIAEGTTNNLMDHGDGKRLYKYQWDKMRYPDIVIDLFEEDEDAESVIFQNIAALKTYINEDKKSYTFITPAGALYTLPSTGLNEIVFYANDASGNLEDGYSTNTYFFPDGALRGFTLNGVKYNAFLATNEQTRFVGYATTAADPSRVDNLTKNLSVNDKKKAIVGLICISNGALTYKVRRVPYQGTEIKSDHTGSGTYQDVLPVNLTESIAGTDGVQEVVLTSGSFNLTTQYNQKALAFLEGIDNCAESFNKYILTIANLINAQEDLFDGCIAFEWVFQNFAINRACSTCITKPWEKPSIADYQQRFNQFLDKIRGVHEVGNTIMATNDAMTMRTVLKSSSQCGWGVLRYDERIHALTVLSKERMNDCGGTGFWAAANQGTFDLFNNCAEDYAIQLLATAPEEQYEKLMNELADNSLFKALAYRLDGNHYDMLMQIVTDWMYITERNYRDKEQLFADGDFVGYITIKNRRYGPEDRATYKTYSYLSEDGTNIHIDFDWENLNNGGPSQSRYKQEKDFSLYSWVLVYFPKAFKMGDADFPAESLVEMPAIYLYWIQARDNSDKNVTDIRRMADVLALITPVGEINTGFRLLNYAIRIAEVALPAVDYVIAGNEPEIVAMDGGREFLEAYTTFVELYGAVAIVRMTPALVYKAGYLVRNASRFAGRGSVAFKKQLAALVEKLEPIVGGAAKSGELATITIVDDALVLAPKELSFIRDHITAAGISSGTVNLIIHGSGENFTLFVNGVERTVTHRTIASIIEQTPEGTTIQLLSCSSLKSAQDIVNKTGRRMRATAGKVRLHADGGVSTVKGEPWYELAPGNAKPVEVVSPTAPAGSAIDDFITLGKDKDGLYTVREETMARDVKTEVLSEDGVYKINVTRKFSHELTIREDGAIIGPTGLNPGSPEAPLHGQFFMYVVDENDNLILGTRATKTEFSNPPGKAPHPTLIGGKNPRVRAAGIVEFRKGFIYKIDNASGHYWPGSETLELVDKIFRKSFPKESFHSTFIKPEAIKVQ